MNPSSILDLDDRSFPLDLGPSHAPIRTLYERSKRLAWDPDTAIPWDQVHPEQYSDAVIEAARLYWSGRAWGEYGAIAESPVLQLRYDADELPADLSLFWALRTQEEARHAEVSARMADALGGYLDQPPAKPEVHATTTSSTSAASVKQDGPYLGTRARALAPELPVEATIAGLVCVAETIVYDVFLDLIRQLRNPVAKEIFRLILRDEIRHCEFGWEYLAGRREHLTGDVLDAVRQSMVAMIETVELGGYRSPWLMRDPDVAAVDSERIVFEAGLGGSTAEWEGPVLVRSIVGIRHRAAGLGIDLPVFHHHLLGAV